MANNVNVTNRGFEYICQWMAAANANGGVAGFTIPSFIGWGGANGYNAAAANLPAAAPTTTQGTGQWSDVAPFQEFSEARVAASSTAVTSNTAASGTVTTQYVGTITAGSGESVGESFLVFTATKPSTFTVNGNVTNVQTSLTVNTTGALANQYFQMNNEVIKISSTAASNVWNIVRAQNGSTAGTAKTNDVLTFGNIPGAGTSNPSNGDMFAHAGFQALALNSGDSIQFTWQINVTS